MMIRWPSRGALSIACAIASVALFACRQETGPRQGQLRLDHAWARAAAAGQESGGVFLTIRGGGAADRLLGGSTTAAQTVQIHAMRMDGAVMRMRRQQSVDIPAEGAVKLEPGGTHLMLAGLKAPLVPGESFDLALDFANAGRRDVAVKVLPVGATGPRIDRDE